MCALLYFKQLFGYGSWRDIRGLYLARAKRTVRHAIRELVARTFASLQLTNHLEAITVRIPVMPIVSTGMAR